MPIAFVVGLSMGKDIYEDVMRHKQDNEENNRKCEVGMVDKDKNVYKFV